MATRKETQERRQALLEELRASCRDGSLSQGELLPPVRDMVSRYNVSHRIIVEVLQTLTEEGLLYSVSRVGTFVGRPVLNKPEYYVFTLPHDTSNFEYARQLKFGFEERISALGGSSLIISHEEMLDQDYQPNFSWIAGIFDMTLSTDNTDIPRLRDAYRPLEIGATNPIPYVQFGDPLVTKHDSDEVQFDNIEGGRQATQHLLHSGHRKIAFLGLHAPVGDPEEFYWSLERENGWKQAMQKAALSVEGLAYYPTSPIRKTHTASLHLPTPAEAARMASAELVKRTDITAVVIANVHAASGFFAALHEAEIPTENWPSVLCFDEVLDIGGSVLSYLRLPWSEIGREAAQILWDRKNGRLTGPNVKRLVPMRLIARLSCRSDWMRDSGFVQSRSLLQSFGEESNPLPSSKAFVTSH